MDKSREQESLFADQGTILEDVSKLILSRSLDGSMRVDLDYDFIFECLAYINQRKLGDQKFRGLSTEDILFMVESSETQVNSSAAQQVSQSDRLLSSKIYETENEILQ